MATIGTRILDLIKERRMTQKEFSEKTGIPQSTISDWKGKGLNPNVDKIMIICEVLNVSPQELLSGDDKSKYSVEYIQIGKDSPEYQLIERYRSLDIRDRMRLEGYMAAFVNK